ncbi:MAG TPA: hypothetical protein VIK40_06920 [Geomonas sp.]
MSEVRYEHVHQNKFIATQARSIGDFIKIFEENLTLLKRWEGKGIQLDPHGVGSCYAIFYTYDEKIAQEEGFERFRTEAGNQLPRR